MSVYFALRSQFSPKIRAKIYRGVLAIVGSCLSLGSPALAVDITDELNQLTTNFNTELEQRINLLNTGLTDINIALFDAGNLFRNVFPTQFSQVSQSCIQGPPLSPFALPSSICANPGDYVYYDNIHPTTAAQESIGDLARSVLTPSVIAQTTEVIIFGDSLSDRHNLFRFSNGTVPPPVVFQGPLTGQPLFNNGAFTNGRLWWEYLVEDLNLPTPEAYYDTLLSGGSPTLTGGLNFAIAGATTGRDNAGNTMMPPFPIDLPGLEDQLDAFTGLLGAGTANPDALYIVWGGANNFLGAFSPPDPSNPFAPFQDFTTNPVQPVDDIANIIQSLYARGARNFLVGNLFDLGDTPLGGELELVNSTPVPEPSTLLGLSIAFGLGVALQGQRKSHPEQE